LLPNLSDVPAVADTKQLVVLSTPVQAQTIVHVRAPLLLIYSWHELGPRRGWTYSIQRLGVTWTTSPVVLH